MAAQKATNSEAKDVEEITPQDIPHYVKRRFHVRTNHEGERETIIIQ